MIKLAGIKVGMTRLFKNNGISIPITLINILDHFIVQIKYIKKDGYNAIQLSTGIGKNINKSLIGHYKKNNIYIGKYLLETKLNDISNYKLGQKITLSNFINYKFINITGKSKGKGFSGVIKRWGFKSQDSSHGNSLSHRAPGSIGQNQSPGRVFKGKKMAGHKGNKNITIKNLKILDIDINDNIIAVCGSVPGYNNSKLFINFL